VIEKHKETLPEILQTLTTAQLKFVARRVYLRTDKEAAEAVGIAPPTVYGWPNKDDVNEAVRLAQMNSVDVGRERLQRLVEQAIDVIEDEMTDDGLRSRDRLKAALEVLDRTGLEAGSRVDVVSEGQRLGVGDDYRAAILGALSRIADAGTASDVAEDADE